MEKAAYSINCTICKGSGLWRRPDPYDTGKIIKVPCPVCNGKGTLEVEEIPLDD